MALARRNRNNMDIWPGFVDALATLLMVIIFLLLIFVISQVFLNDALVGRDKALDKLNLQVSELADMLKLERASSADLRNQVSDLSSELRASLAKRADLEAQLKSLSGENEGLKKELEASEGALAVVSADLEDAYKTIEANKETIEAQLGQLALLENQIEALKALKEELESEAASKLAQADEEVVAARAEAALLNQQLKALGAQIEELNNILAASELKDAEQQAQIEALGKRLNKALASKVQELSKYRSEFFGRLREILGNRRGVQIVNDRFVFQSEVLFTSGSADLGPSGEEQLSRLATTLLDISRDIPEKLNWVLQVEGHTDAQPISTAQFPSNWELSAARAISVVKFLRSQGLPAQHLSAVGYGEFQPLDPRDDEIAYRRNRRIELKLTQR
ncbi:peptidoglycan -binding protein [Curvivirga aplysinae]|uniref:peptidoglycan -binding protein n=1 Tax=Curvivirga aplysinae TaxID=2529852 RepID=UPI0012BC5F9D|nr:peptidoglycan -binding protein [Curvivirga aplysinae]MTI11100.1 peptidoglycan -binding protein [Curvivirga aplysinae]